MNVSGAKEINRKLAQTGRAGGSPGSNPFASMYKSWAVRYSAFVRRRFNRFSRGGGNWKALKASTKKGRRKGKGAGNAAILKDKGILFGALTIGASGNVTNKIPQGIEFGFGGGDRHADASMSIAKLAEIHQKGSATANIPARPIIVQPDAGTRRGMFKDVKRAFNRKWGVGLR